MKEEMTIESGGKTFLDVKSTVLISMITFLVGGYLGDWNASAKAQIAINNNEEKIDGMIKNTAVMENSIQNIERMVEEIKSDVKDLKK